MNILSQIVEGNLDSGLVYSVVSLIVMRQIFLCTGTGYRNAVRTCTCLAQILTLKILHCMLDMKSLVHVHA